MKIAIAQMDIIAGQCELNFNKMKQMITSAKKDRADLIVFPEMSITGYMLQDKWTDSEFLKTVMEYNHRLCGLSEGIGIIYGNVFIDVNATGRDGRVIRYNAAYFCMNKQWVNREHGKAGIYVKHLLPEYRMFDDERYFTSALDMGLSHEETCSPFIVEIAGKQIKIGLEVCEDLWSKDYSFDVTKHYLDKNVDLIVNVSSSPWTLNKELSRDKQVQAHYKMNGKFVPFVYANASGMQNTGKTICMMDGNSRVYNEHAECIASCNDAFNEELKVVDLSTIDIEKPVENKLFHALISAIKQVDKQMFNSSVRWIIGLSGGLDSTINACLLTYALGANRVIGYNMASQYNSDTTKNNARKLAEGLGIEIREGSIEGVVNATLGTMKEYKYMNADHGLVFENIQARIRGHLLSTFASLEGGVVINNGNKVEVALGYCTMYGDSIGAFSPLGDCTKVQLFELGYLLNKVFNKEVVPTNLLPQVEGDIIKWELPPSAELKDNQLDPMKWFYHDWLISKITEYPGYQIESICESYLDGSLLNSEMGQWIKYYGLDDPKKFIDDLEWVLSTMKKAVFKRLQMPPIVLVSRGSFGNDFRESQINTIPSMKYMDLKEKILLMKGSL